VVKELIYNGALGPRDLAWCPGMPEWKRVCDIEVLSSLSSKEGADPAAEPSLPSLQFSTILNPKPNADPSVIALKSSEESVDSSIPSISFAFTEHSDPHLASMPAPRSLPPESSEDQAKIDSLDQLASEPFGTTTVHASYPVELETRTFLKSFQFTGRKSSKSAKLSSDASKPKRFKTEETDPFASSEALPQFSRGALIMAFALIATVVISGIISFKGRVLIDELAPLPDIPELSEKDYAALKSAAAADLMKAGPKYEMATAVFAGGKTSLYFATNAPDHTAFDLTIKPFTETIVGEPTDILPMRREVKRHLIQFDLGKTAPGYYLVNVAVSVTKENAITRKLFFGGRPDLGYQSHLKDYTAVRRGIARAELERLRDCLAKMEALVSADNQAALALNAIHVSAAKPQAWEMFENTWNQSFIEIQSLVVKPMRFSGRLQALARDLQDPLRKLHEKHHELVKTATPFGAAQLSHGSVTNAKILAEAQAIKKDIDARFKTLKSQIEARDKSLGSQNEPLLDDPFSG
jgi:hypothetical protein